MDGGARFYGTVKALKCIGVVVRKAIVVDGAYQLH